MKSAGISLSSTMLGIAAMAFVVLASNILVQYPVHAQIGIVQLADLLTWGAFTYPAAFLVTDLTNRRFGPAAARRVVMAGFVVAVVLSVLLATPRIAIASGSAFLVAQLLDVTIFDALRRQTWWKAPFISSLIGSTIDTVLFFTLAFSATWAVLGGHDAFAVEGAPLFGVFSAEYPRWVSWALGDFCVKMLVATGLLIPYRIVVAFIRPWQDARAV
ncbi:MAG: queuosine precursor transporter [Stappiaceae bacterium]